MQFICYNVFEEGLHLLKNKVKIARVQVDLTQQQLAEKIGITRQTISLIEKGKYNPTLKLCLDICYAVNKTLNEVFWIEKKSDENEKN
jgi:putative transcriptional regulator